MWYVWPNTKDWSWSTDGVKNLDDFKVHSCWTPFAYIYLWIMLIVSISIYAVDTFTAINLVVFDKWAGQIKPSIPFNISRWIFAGCIILSFVFLAYRMLRAIRVVKQGGVAKSYLDPLAVRWQSIRMGKEGRGFKRFLVFAELTKSRKGADYVALFAYFSFEAWMRIVFAEGPRQVVNALTLYSVMQLNLIPEGEHAAPKGKSPVAQFFVNIGVMAGSDRLQAVILFGMLWTLFIWVLEAISLAVSVILYLLFLWHHIPSGDGGLSGYCRKKINRRMERIVKVKVDKALKKENELQARRDALAARDGMTIKKQPTLPDLGAMGTESLAPLSRTTTMSTLPEYTSRPGTARLSDESIGPVPPMPDLKSRPGAHRVMTHTSETSWASFNSDAPLMGGAGEMGYAATPGQSTSGTTPSPWDNRPPPNRSMTGQSSYSQRSYSPAPSRTGTAQGGRNAYPMEPISRPATGSPPRRPSEFDSMIPYPLGSSRTPSWDHPSEVPVRRMPANQSNPYFPPIQEAGYAGRQSPAPRSQSRGPSERTRTPVGPMLPRIPTFGSTDIGRGPSQRPFTPASGPGPALPLVQTSTEQHSYRAFGPGPNSSGAGTPASAAPSYQSNSFGSLPPNGRQTPQSGYPRPPPQRRGKTFDDILNH